MALSGRKLVEDEKNVEGSGHSLVSPGGTEGNHKPLQLG
jgi:hypothetical protein